MIAQAKFDEANTYINQISDDSQRINALIYLANAIYQKDPPENQKWAERVLDQARALLPDNPETQNDLNAATALATAFAQFDAKESFRLLELMLPMLNELVQANFVLMKFRNYGGFRHGEIQIGGNNLGIYNLDRTLRALRNRDFDRALQLTNGFNRPEIRIWLQIQLIDENSPGTLNLPVISRQFIRSGG